MASPDCDRLVLFVAVSDRSQKHHLKGQLDRLKTECERRGFKIVAIVQDVSSAVSNPYRLKFQKAVRLAKQHGASICVQHVNRYIRSEGYSKHNQGAEPSDEEYKQLEQAADGVTLYSLLDPEMGWKKVRSEQTKNSPRNGRPRKTFDRTQERRIRDEKIKWFSLMGVGPDTVAKIVGISDVAVRKRQKVLKVNLFKRGPGQRGTKINFKH